MIRVFRVVLKGSRLACLFFAGHVAAQSTLSLREAIQDALRANPQLALTDARIEEAKGQRTQAGLRPNPRVTVQTEDIRPSTPGLPFSFVNSTEDYLLLAQVIETGGKRGRRLDLANAGVTTNELEEARVRRQIVAQVSAAYWTAVSSQRVKELSEQNLRTYEEDVTYSANRVREGVAAEADLIRIQIERDRVRIALLTAALDADQAVVALYRAMGRSTFGPAQLTDPLQDGGAVGLPDIARVLAARPEMRVAQEAVRQAEAELRLQRADAKPDPEAFVGYKRNVGSDTAYAAVQIDLPVRNRNQGNIASAAARVHQAEAHLRATEIMIRAEVEAAQRAYMDERELLRDLPATVARAEESERLARAAYREGALDLLRLLDAERSRIQEQLEYSRSLADLQQRVVNLQLASGEQFEGEQ